MLPIGKRFLKRSLRSSVLLGYLLLPITDSGTALGATVTLVAPAATPSRECQSHVVDARAAEIIAPCGQPIRTSIDLTVGWIETADRIAPFLTDVSRGGEQSIDRLVPSGTVTFPQDRHLGANERIRLISLIPPRDATSLRSLFVRDITSLKAKPRMPEGKAIAMLLDEQDRAIAVSRPVAIRAGEETFVWPDADGEASLVARLSLPRRTQLDDHLGLRATTSNGTRPPSERVDAADTMIAVWYDLPAGDVRLLVESARVRLGQDAVTLARGSVRLFEESLIKLPSLTVSIGASADEPIDTLKLRISDATDENKTIRSLRVDPGSSNTIEFLPAALLNLDLQIGDYLLAKRVDLRSGADANLTIPLEPLRVSGTVSHGDNPARATLRFVQKGKPLTVETDDRGAYMATLWQPQRYVIETTLADQPDVPPFSEMVLISASRTLDFNIPANTLRARIFDAADGKPLDRGEIMIHNRWSDQSGSPSAVTTVAISGPMTGLPPQRIGTTEIRVRAAGYGDAGPILVQVDQNLRDQIIEIPMTRSAEITDMVILIDGVLPAAGAEIAAFSNDQMTWHGTADGEGRIAIPESVTRTRVVVRHPSAASDVVIFGKLSGPQRFSLARAAPPLAVNVVRRDGTRIGPAAAKLSIWLTGGVRLTGAEAAFATWSLAATAPDGTFIARGLHPKPLRLFATRQASFGQIQTGTFDGLATTIPYPWPATSTVQVIDE